MELCLHLVIIIINVSGCPRESGVALLFSFHHEGFGSVTFSFQGYDASGRGVEQVLKFFDSLGLRAADGVEFCLEGCRASGGGVTFVFRFDDQSLGHVTLSLEFGSAGCRGIEQVLQFFHRFGLG